MVSNASLLDEVTAYVQPVGSTSVRTAIERVQPLLGLHRRHIHESRGAVRIGRTLALNPGSSYEQGVLQGAFVTLGPESQDKTTCWSTDRTGRNSRHS